MIRSIPVARRAADAEDVDCRQGNVRRGGALLPAQFHSESGGKSRHDPLLVSDYKPYDRFGGQ